MEGGSLGSLARAGLVLGLAALLGAGCGSASSLDGGGRGTGIGAVAVQGNIADSGPAASSEPSCPALSQPATVSVRGTDLTTEVAPDCTFELFDVPPGDVTLDFSTGGESSALTVNGVPAETVLVLTDVRLRPEQTDVSAVDVRPTQPAPPRAFGIIAEPPSGDTPLAVQFSFAPEASEGAQIRWSFGDRSKASEDPTPEHTYASPGDFVVTLAVSEPGRGTKTSYLVVRATTPPARVPLSVRLAARPQSGPPPLEVNFAAEVTGAAGLRGLVWDFGDGTPPVRTADTTIAHVFQRPGSFLVIATAVDDLGRQAGNSFPIVVERSAVPVRPTRTPALALRTRGRAAATKSHTPDQER